MLASIVKTRTIKCFPALVTSCIFSRACHRLHVRRLHVFPRLAPVACFPALVTAYLFSRLQGDVIGSVITSFPVLRQTLDHKQMRPTFICVGSVSEKHLFLALIEISHNFKVYYAFVPLLRNKPGSVNQLSPWKLLTCLSLLWQRKDLREQLSSVSASSSRNRT